VTVVYHCEAGEWWADSPDAGLETFVAGGRSLEETRRLAREGLEFHLGEVVSTDELFEPMHVVTLLEIDPDRPAGMVVFGGPSTACDVPPKVTVEPEQPRVVVAL
jgi:predicted RNase H-like HicB family nuclease